ncbi:MAG: UDP-N-acetylglucosamine 1-carboxyvinyltransferase [Oscillospiraceae bacterium]|nr:UDP-N-acetylglucosamine 1-carboxyvinyltransferase [Oscillospiraceae bacterium]
MDIWHIRGGRRLEGACPVQGSKNASLPILAAAILAPLRCELHNVPRLRDVDAALRILRCLGCLAEQRENDVYIDSTTLSGCSIPHSLMEEMRSSVIFMGALLARCGEARLSLPGGCQLGKRPIDLHLAALRQLGAEIEEDGTDICCRAARLKGAEIALPFPSVGATENAMLAACAAKGTTTIRGAAKEPEIQALQAFLSRAGAGIGGAGSDTIRIEGFDSAARCVCRIIPDRIVASTLACAAAATGGDVSLCGIDPRHFSALLYFLNKAGCDIISSNRSVRIRSRGRLRAAGEIVTEPYPGFPTDAQPVLMAAMLQAEGETRIRETIFENRFRQVPELRRLGADIAVCGQTAEIRGVDRLHGAALTATDLRGGAAMIVAGLAACGDTVICDDGHVSRGYESFDRCLCALGADICFDHGI